MAEVKTNLRLSEELYKTIKQFAAKDLRSINAEMVVLLQEAIVARQRQQKEEKREDN